MLTDFINFVTRTGGPRIRAVRDVARRTGYLPRFDYWKPLRDGIRKIHQAGEGPDELDRIIETVPDPARVPNYEIAIAGYRKFWGRKNLEYFDAPRADYTIADLTVRVNPELGLYINGVPHVIKLYFRLDPLPRQTADLITHIMEASLRDHVDEETVIAVLDVPRAKLYTATEAPAALDALLEAEALAYSRLRESL